MSRRDSPVRHGNWQTPVRIFLSYAWNDNVRPPNDPDAKGFVTALYAQLQYELTLLGPPKPEIWWDIDNVKDGDLFDPKIKDAIGKSALFIPVLSRNWTSREYCLNELEMFRQRWAVEAENDFKVEHRIIVVRKDLVDDARCPPLLRASAAIPFSNSTIRKRPAARPWGPALGRPLNRSR